MEAGMTKAQRKNAARAAKRREESIKKSIAQNKNAYVPAADPVADLKKQMKEAKDCGDLKLAAKLRQDLWILQDVNSGMMNF